MNKVRIGAVVRLRDLGLERLDEDKAIIGFAEKTEGKLTRWLDFAKDASCLSLFQMTRNPARFTSTTAQRRSFTGSLCLWKVGLAGSAMTSSTG